MSLHLHEEAAHAATEIGADDGIARGVFLWPLLTIAAVALGALVAVLW